MAVETAVGRTDGSQTSVQVLTKLHTLAGVQSVNLGGFVCGPDGRPVDDISCDSRPCLWSLYPSRSGIGLVPCSSVTSAGASRLIVLLMNLVAVELSVWIGDFGCGHPISLSALRSGTISRAVM